MLVRSPAPTCIPHTFSSGSFFLNKSISFCFNLQYLQPKEIKIPSLPLGLIHYTVLLPSLVVTVAMEHCYVKRRLKKKQCRRPVICVLFPKEVN